MRPYSVAIGIHGYAQPEGWRATLAALHANTDYPAQIVLLPDGPDAETQAALSAIDSLLRLPTDRARGAPACFNRLVSSLEADLYLLLESGSLAGPGWLTQLVAALEAAPAAGLAGPSTNRAWNEQRAFPGADGTPAGIARAAEAARRLSPKGRGLEPLYSLADFCYLVRREVVEAIGAADEGYGLGPCWEMDYNIRAARAGFQGVWAAAAFVYRLPPSARRRRDEAACFAASKRRYQDRFCGLRLAGSRAAYEPHCRGDACPHFAPPEAPALRERLPLPPGEKLATGRAAALRSVSPAALPRPTVPSVPGGSAAPGLTGRTFVAGPAAPPAPLPAAAGCRPLISCLMPTRGRPGWVAQSVRYFLRQDYPERELLILDEPGPDGPEGVPDLPDDPRIRYYRVEPGLSLGAKRNRGCELARGDIVAQWDDDDWYGPGRLSTQAAPILAGEADVTGLEAGLFFEAGPWRFWRCTPALHGRLFVGDVHGGTLVFRRDVWGRLGRYPDRSLAEDAIFLRQVVARGARLRRLPNDGLFVYVRHGNNAWSFAPGRYLDSRGWEPAAEPPFLAADRAFYLGIARAETPAAAGARRQEGGRSQSAGPLLPPSPLVSAIMPTAGRRAFVELAVAYFARQDYARRELIVVDDGPDPIADLLPPEPGVRYIRLPRRRSLGEKRNVACEAARGEVIVHWDDDDWMAPDRLSRQVAALVASGADVCGLDRVAYYEPAGARAWEYVYPPGGRAWVAGNTLCYRREVWRANAFPAVSVGEDNRFLWSGRPKKVVPMAVVGRPTFIVGLIHAGNASPKRTGNPRWHAYPVDVLRAVMGQDWERYSGQDLAPG